MILHRTLEDEIQARLEELEEILEDAPQDVKEKLRDWVWWFKSDILPILPDIENIESLNSDIDSLQDKISNLETEKEGLEWEIEDLEAERDNLESEIDKLRDELHELEIQKRELEGNK